MNKYLILALTITLSIAAFLSGYIVAGIVVLPVGLLFFALAWLRSKELEARYRKRHTIWIRRD